MHLFGLALCVLKHPFSTFRLVKYDREKFSWLPAITIYLLVVVCNVAGLFLTHFPLSYATPENSNFLLEIVLILVPLISFSICSFALSAIMSGSSTLPENITATAFCMMPYILLNVPIALLTRVLEFDDMSVYRILLIAMWVWIIFLLFFSVKVINEFTLVKTIVIVALTLFTILLLWIVLILLYALANQFVEFIVGIIKELRFAIFEK